MKLNREAEELTFAPLQGELGKRIYENVSQEAWQAWLEHQKMLVNENRLSLADPAARKYLMGQTDNISSGQAQTPRVALSHRLRADGQRSGPPLGPGCCRSSA